jgi:hypothetical protein
MSALVTLIFDLLDEAATSTTFINPKTIPNQMQNYKQHSIERSKHDFELFKSKPTFTVDDQEKLLWDITDLLGWFRIKPEQQLAHLIEAMISFGEKKQWSMAGARTQFNKLKPTHPKR